MRPSCAVPLRSQITSLKTTLTISSIMRLMPQYQIIQLYAHFLSMMDQVERFISGGYPQRFHQFHNRVLEPPCGSFFSRISFPQPAQAATLSGATKWPNAWRNGV